MMVKLTHLQFADALYQRPVETVTTVRFVQQAVQHLTHRLPLIHHHGFRALIRKVHPDHQLRETADQLSVFWLTGLGYNHIWKLNLSFIRTSTRWALIAEEQIIIQKNTSYILQIKPNRDTDSNVLSSVSFQTKLCIKTYFRKTELFALNIASVPSLLLKCFSQHHCWKVTLSNTGSKHFKIQIYRFRCVVVAGPVGISQIQWYG